MRIKYETVPILTTFDFNLATSFAWDNCRFHLTNTTKEALGNLVTGGWPGLVMRAVDREVTVGGLPLVVGYSWYVASCYSGGSSATCVREGYRGHGIGMTLFAKKIGYVVAHDDRPEHMRRIPVYIAGDNVRSIRMFHGALREYPELSRYVTLHLGRNHDSEGSKVQLPKNRGIEQDE